MAYCRWLADLGFHQLKAAYGVFSLVPSLPSLSFDLTRIVVNHTEEVCTIKCENICINLLPRSRGLTHTMNRYLFLILVRRLKGMTQHWSLKIRPSVADNSSLTRKYGWRHVRTFFLVSGHPLMKVFFTFWRVQSWAVSSWICLSWGSGIGRKSVAWIASASSSALDWRVSARYISELGLYIRSTSYCWSPNKSLFRGFAAEARGVL